MAIHGSHEQQRLGTSNSISRFSQPKHIEVVSAPDGDLVGGSMIVSVRISREAPMRGRWGEEWASAESCVEESRHGWRATNRIPWVQDDTVNPGVMAALVRLFSFYVSEPRRLYGEASTIEESN